MQQFGSNLGSLIGLAILIGAAVWIHRDAKAIGDDDGRSPGIVNTQPTLWAVGVFLLLILVLPAYLLMRIHYKKQLAERRAAFTASRPDSGTATEPGTWPPPPNAPPA